MKMDRYEKELEILKTEFEFRKDISLAFLATTLALFLGSVAIENISMFWTAILRGLAIFVLIVNFISIWKLSQKYNQILEHLNN